MGEWEPFSKNRTDLTLDLGQRLSPYFFAGAGMIFISPKPVFGEPDEAAAEDLNADYSNVQLMCPLGLPPGQASMRRCPSLEPNAQNPDRLSRGELRGKKDTDDWYLFGAPCSFTDPDGKFTEKITV